MRMELSGQKPCAVEGLANMYVAGRHWSWGKVESDDTTWSVHLSHSFPKQPFMAQTR